MCFVYTDEDLIRLRGYGHRLGESAGVEHRDNIKPETRIALERICFDTLCYDWDRVKANLDTRFGLDIADLSDLTEQQASVALIQFHQVAKEHVQASTRQAEHEREEWF
jgi:hypothetical protein